MRLCQSDGTLVFLDRSGAGNQSMADRSIWRNSYQDLVKSIATCSSGCPEVGAAHMSVHVSTVSYNLESAGWISQMGGNC